MYQIFVSYLQIKSIDVMYVQIFCATSKSSCLNLRKLMLIVQKDSVTFEKLSKWFTLHGNFGEMIREEHEFKKQEMEMEKKNRNGDGLARISI